LPLHERMLTVLLCRCPSGDDWLYLTSGRRPDVLPSNCRGFFVKPCSLAEVEREISGLA